MRAAAEEMILAVIKIYDEKTKNKKADLKLRIVPRKLAMEVRRSFLSFRLLSIAEGVPSRFFDFDSYVRDASYGLDANLPKPVLEAISRSERIRSAYITFFECVQKCPRGYTPAKSNCAYRDDVEFAAILEIRKLLSASRGLEMELCILEQTEKEAKELSDEKYSELTRRMESMAGEMQKEERRRLAKSGADAKADKMTPLITYSFQLALDGSYPSRRNAAMCIKDRVLAKAKELGITLSEMQVVTTIINWLKKAGYNPRASRRSMSAS